MSLQGLLQKGSDNCSTLEGISDAFLALPRNLWLGKEVKVIKDAHVAQIVKANSFLNSKWLKNGDDAYTLETFRVTFITGPLFLAISLIALPFLGIGVILKKSAIGIDPKAKNYHDLIELSMKESELKKEASTLKIKKTELEGQLFTTQKQLALPDIKTKKLNKNLLSLQKFIQNMQLIIEKTEQKQLSFQTKIQEIFNKLD